MLQLLGQTESCFSLSESVTSTLGASSPVFTLNKLSERQASFGRERDDGNQGTEHFVSVAKIRGS
jgi:hypothetical protein